MHGVGCVSGELFRPAARAPRGVSGTLCVTAQRCDDHRRTGEHAPLHGGGDFGSHPTPAPR